MVTYDRYYLRKIILFIPFRKLAQAVPDTDTGFKAVIQLQRFAVRRKNAVWIDTTQPIENSIRDAKTAILNMMSIRFKDVL